MKTLAMNTTNSDNSSDSASHNKKSSKSEIEIIDQKILKCINDINHLKQRIQKEWSKQMSSHLKGFYSDDAMNGGNESGTSASLNSMSTNSTPQAGAESSDCEKRIGVLSKKLRSYEKRRQKIIHESSSSSSHHTTTTTNTNNNSTSNNSTLNSGKKGGEHDSNGVTAASGDNGKSSRAAQNGSHNNPALSNSTTAASTSAATSNASLAATASGNMFNVGGEAGGSSSSTAQTSAAMMAAAVADSNINTPPSIYNPLGLANQSKLATRNPSFASVNNNNVNNSTNALLGHHLLAAANEDDANNMLKLSYSSQTPLSSLMAAAAAAAAASSGGENDKSNVPSFYINSEAVLASSHAKLMAGGESAPASTASNDMNGALADLNDMTSSNTLSNTKAMFDKQILFIQLEQQVYYLKIQQEKMQADLDQIQKKLQDNQQSLIKELQHTCTQLSEPVHKLSYNLFKFFDQKIEDLKGSFERSVQSFSYNLTHVHRDVKEMKEDVTYMKNRVEILEKTQKVYNIEANPTNYYQLFYKLLDIILTLATIILLAFTNMVASVKFVFLLYPRSFVIFLFVYLFCYYLLDFDTLDDYFHRTFLPDSPRRADIAHYDTSTSNSTMMSRIVHSIYGLFYHFRPKSSSSSSSSSSDTET